MRSVPPPKDPGDRPASVPVLRLRDLTVVAGDVIPLRGVDLEVAAGERVALVGPSGAGKSTLLDVAAGLRPATSGAVEVLGRDPHDLGRRDRRRHGSKVGLIRQHVDVALPLRAVHNVNAGRLGQWSTLRSLRSLIWPVERNEAQSALGEVGLADRLNTRTEDLSGGERQRVAVARVLRQEPELVLADEPTSSVDPRLADHVLDLLMGPQAPWTAVVSIHDPERARLHADRIVGLRHGEVVFDVSARAATDAMFADLYEIAP